MACRKLEILDEFAIAYTPDKGITSAELADINSSPPCSEPYCGASCVLMDRGQKGRIYQYALVTYDDTCSLQLEHFSLTVE